MQILSRRRFLGNSFALPAAAVLAGSLQRAHAAAGGKVGGFLIGPQCWTFRNFSVVEAIEFTAKAGGSICEFFPGQKLIADKADQRKWSHDSGEEETKVVQEACAKHGVTPMNYGVVGVPADEAGARKVFDFAKRWKLHGITTESDKSIDILSKLAEEYGIKVCFHNHPERKNDANYKVWNPKYIMELTKDRHANVGACADTGHWVTSGLAPLSA
jgi:sugar phosphate isomerase/epimerase